MELEGQRRVKREQRTEKQLSDSRYQIPEKQRRVKREKIRVETGMKDFDFQF